MYGQVTLGWWLMHFWLKGLGNNQMKTWHKVLLQFQEHFNTMCMYQSVMLPQKYTLLIKHTNKEISSFKGRDIFLCKLASFFILKQFLQPTAVRDDCTTDVKFHIFGEMVLNSLMTCSSPVHVDVIHQQRYHWSFTGSMFLQDLFKVCHSSAHEILPANNIHA